MEQQPFTSYVERSKEDNSFNIEKSSTLQKLDLLKREVQHEKEFSLESWQSFEESIETLGFKKKDAQAYLTNVATHHGYDVFVRRASMNRLLEGMEHDEPLNIAPLDLEPNVSLLGRDASGVESALSSGFGWVVDNKIAGAFGFTNNDSHLSVDLLKDESLSHQKKSGELMRRISGKLVKEDVLFVMFRIHKSVFPKEMLEESDTDDMGDLYPFIIRLYAKHRQAH